MTTNGRTLRRKDAGPCATVHDHKTGASNTCFTRVPDEAHARGLRGIDTELVQVPPPRTANVALVKAVVEREAADGPREAGPFRHRRPPPRTFGRNIVPHIIRMAETRAKARALRDAVTVGRRPSKSSRTGDEAPPAAFPPRAAFRAPGEPARRSASSAPNGRASSKPRPVERDRGFGRGHLLRRPRDGARGGPSEGSARARSTAEDPRRGAAGWNGVARLESRIGAFR